MSMNYDGFLSLVNERFSVRKFDKTPVPSDIVEKILKVGTVAPTACNKQPQRILVINTADALEKLRKCTPCHFDCTLAMLICIEKDECWTSNFDGRKSGDVDAAIVITHMMLAAKTLGIGSTWVMYYNPKAVRTEFAIPAKYSDVSLLVMGYPAADAKPYPAHSDKKPISETVFYNSFD